jgi:Tripartite tricarboxylate transporter TctB family
MPDGSSPRTDLALGLFLIVVCGAVLWESRTIPPGVFEPLGSAPIPQATAGLIILLALVVMARALRSLRQGAGARPAEDGLVLRPLDAAAVIGLSVLYVFAMALRTVDFALLTALFLILTIGVLTRFERRLLPIIIVLALVTGYGCQYVFTRIFVVDLPGL